MTTASGPPLPEAYGAINVYTRIIVDEALMIEMISLGSVSALYVRSGSCVDDHNTCRITAQLMPQVNGAFTNARGGTVDLRRREVVTREHGAARSFEAPDR